MKTTTKYLILIFISVILLLISTAPLSAANTPIGKVIDIEGLVKSTNEANIETQLTIGSDVFLMDRIITETNSKIGVGFNDGSYVAVGPDSNLIFDTFIYKPKGKNNRFNFTALKGIFLVIAGKISKTGNNYTATTPTAVLGVRGTAFGIICNPSEQIVKQFNDLKEGDEGLTLSSDSFYSINFAGDTNISNQNGSVELKGPCPACIVEPADKEKLAFFDPLNTPNPVMSDSGLPLFPNTLPENPILAYHHEGFPKNGSAPQILQTYIMARQFAVLYYVIFQSFPRAMSPFLTYYLQARFRANMSIILFRIAIGGLGAGGCGKPCFLSDTKVLMHDGSYRSISKLKEGQMVQTLNRDTGIIEKKPIVKLYEFEVDEYVLINGSLKPTPGHPFLMASSKEVWKKAADLKPGDRVVSNGKEILIESVESVKPKKKVKTYNFQVSDSKNYIVSDDKNNYVVHNGL